MSEDTEHDEEITIDFSKIKSWFKKKKEEFKAEEKASEPKIEEKSKEEVKPETTKQEVKQEAKHEIKEEPKTEVKKDDEEISIDFSKIKDTFKGWFKGNKEKTTSHGSEDEEEGISVNWKEVGSFFAKYKTLLLLIIPLFLCIYIRMQPAMLPITDSWATNGVHSQIKSQIAAQINQQYPNLPAENKNALIETQFKQVLSEQKTQIDQQVKATSDFFKSKLKDEHGTTYLLAIDPYFWMRHAKNIVDHGHPGDEIRNGVPYNTYMYAPGGRDADVTQWHAYFEAYLYKFLRVFNPDLTLMGLAFYLPILISALSIIPAFFITKKIGGNVGGLFGSIMVAVHPAFLTRTAGGFADTDAYNVFFPLLITWCFLIAFESKELKKKIPFAALTGFLTAVYHKTWIGWWYIFDFLVAAMGIYLAYYVIINYKGFIKKPLNMLKNATIKNSLLVLIVFFVVCGTFVTLFTNFRSFYAPILGPLDFTQMKTIGVQGSVWPNVFTTVAEQNVSSLAGVINQISLGRRFMFYLSLLGILLTFLKKDEFTGKIDVKYAILLVVWFVSTIYAGIKGIRFSLLLVPAFGVAFGIAIGIIYKYALKWGSKELKLNKYLVATSLLLLFSLILTQPIKSAYGTAINEIPSMNDAWYESLSKIDREAADNAIINSWWDFGHWFKAIGNRPVTFDGTSQSSPQAHWIGHVLLTGNEEEAIGILRMLDCSGHEKGGTRAYTELNKILDDEVETIDTLYTMFTVKKDEAKKILLSKGLSEEQSNNIVEYSHCDNPPENYFITSQDMIRKSGVWAHFGSWNFEKAKIYTVVKSKNKDEAINYIINRFNYTAEEADNIYYEVKALTNNDQVNSWIAPWPSYSSDLQGCSKDEKDQQKLRCGQGLEIDLDTFEITIPSPQGEMYPKVFVYPDLTGLHKMEYTQNTIPYGVTLVPQGKDAYAILLMSPELADSTFTRLFYLRGHGSKYFKRFSFQKSVVGENIWVWKIDWEGSEPNVIEEFLESEQIRAAHILICHNESLNCKSDLNKKEAFEQAKMILNLTKDRNFAFLAAEYSYGPTRTKGGDLGWFSQGVMVKEFEDVAFALEKGNISKVVETPFGYHIIKLIDKKTSEEATQDKLKELELKSKNEDE